jgi:serine phosphatase RsbU (regulator of sigma subunit)
MVVSDGIFEACNAKKQFFEISGMVKVCDDHRRHRPEQLLAALRDAVRAWEGGRDPIDDQTIVIVQRSA